jgi:dihydrofolate reductase
MLSLIVAMSENRVIGRNGGLPWRLAADLRRFRRLTMGHPLLMGRKTFESIGRVLPGRTSVVITRQDDYTTAGAVVAHSLEQARLLTSDDDQVFVIGGAEIYRLALPVADRICLTLIHAQVAGDTFFPELSPGDWQLTETIRHPRDEQNEYDHSFLTYARVSHVCPNPT